MIGLEDIEYHVPEGIDYKFAETNYFIAMIPEERILATFYTVTRKAVGVCLVDVAIYGCLSDNRGEMLYYDSQQQLPAPERLSRFETPNGMKVHAHDPRNYTLDYVGFDDTEAHLEVRGLTEPFDINDPRHSPHAKQDANARAEQSGLGTAYSNHFDMPCHVTGTLRIRGKDYRVDCVSTMDHSWGDRCEIGLRSMAWTNANFGEDYGLHWINSLDFTKPAGEQEKLSHGYVFENGELYGLTDLRLKTNRLGSIAVTIDAVATDVRGKRHVLYGSPLVGAPWSCYTSVMLYVAMSRWITDEGRIGHGLNMENHPLDMMARLRGRRWTAAPGAICT
ncbi:hypothetical protein U8326_11230 [Tsuneonella sp. CC-YZS046]|uniref:DUF7065 domain-containing protein n=1 Tax=Tsuneonella sp. CC-YZS046 TaxID=3042152 RepID=UPI002D78D49E|nr:hypothetical protein [Tsuneonella sp. CC-YZS046]WRO65621.1 hypothetical protein U8326_11230 [Tsuneonella sp. CC-YZS046]